MSTELPSQVYEQTFDLANGRQTLAFVATCRRGCGYSTLPILNVVGAIATRDFHENKVCGSQHKPKRNRAGNRIAQVRRRKAVR